MRHTIFTILLYLSFSGVSILAQDAPAGSIEFKPQSIDYHTRKEDTCSSRKVVATNNTGQPIENPEFRITGSHAFSIQRGFKKCPNPLATGQQCRIYVNFCPPLTDTYKATLFFQGDLNYIEMVGTGVSPSF